jgi:hypothetical protein
MTLSELARRIGFSDVGVVDTAWIVEASLRATGAEENVVQQALGSRENDNDASEEGGRHDALDVASRAFGGDFWSSAASAALDVSRPHHGLAYALVRGLRPRVVRDRYRAMVVDRRLEPDELGECMKLLGAIGEPDDAQIIVDTLLALEDRTSFCAGVGGLEYLIFGYGPDRFEALCRRLAVESQEDCVLEILVEHYPPASFRPVSLLAIVGRRRVTTEAPTR